MKTAVCMVLVAVIGIGAIALAGCHNGDDDGGGRPCMYMGRTYQAGDVFPAGDNCNSCTCNDGQVACTLLACVDGGVPDGPTPGACAPTQGCPAGPACGGLCCDTGERCENGVCMCGQNPACGTGDDEGSCDPETTACH